MSPFVVRFRLLLPVFITLSLAAQAQYKRVADTITFSRYKIVLNNTGLPAQVSTYATSSAKAIDTASIMLTEPVHFHISDSATRKDIKFTSKGITYTGGDKKHTLLEWHAVNSSPTLEMEIEGNLQKENMVSFHIALRALQNTSVADIKLHLPFVIEKNQFVAGLGRKGILTDTIQWKWSPMRKDDGIAVNAGEGNLWLVLRDNTEWPAVPASWSNNGKGGMWVGIKGKSLLAEGYSGARTILAGEVLYYNFFLTLRPALH
jgi:hypothetical protein